MRFIAKIFKRRAVDRAGQSQCLGLVPTIPLAWISSTLFFFLLFFSSTWLKGGEGRDKMAEGDFSAYQ